MTQPLERLRSNPDRPLMHLRDAVPELDELVRDKKVRFHEGKVRDTVDFGDHLLVVATDRISTYDVNHPNGIPGKGDILTGMTLGWLRTLSEADPNHLVSADIKWLAAPFDVPELEGRSMIVKKLRMLPAEFIVRGYLTGSGMKDYKEKGMVSGIHLPPGMVEAQQLYEPIFTPSTKAEVGHDENMDYEKMISLIAKKFPELDAELVGDQARRKALNLYKAAPNYALPRGIIIADTKFEFGIDENGNVVLADEVLTPDSSRFWPAEEYKPGQIQNSFDKQYVRDYWTRLDPGHTPPAPYLPEHVVENTRQKYLEAQRRLFAQPLAA